MTIDKTPTVTGSVLEKTKEREVVTGGLDKTGGNEKVETSGGNSIYDTNTDDMGKQEFLNLLITSLRYQDPLNPASNEQFIAQMAQFSGLEATQNTNKAIEGMAVSMEKLIGYQQQAADIMSGSGATGLLGKTVRLDASQVDFTGSAVNFDVHVEDGKSAILSVVNEKNEVVNVVELVDSKGNVTEGDFLGNSWDGRTADGSKAPLGKYHFKVTTKDGSQDVGYVYVQDKVSGISYTADGTMLTIGGKDRPFKDIIHVSDVSADNKSVGPGAVKTTANEITQPDG